MVVVRRTGLVCRYRRVLELFLVSEEGDGSLNDSVEKVALAATDSEISLQGHQ